LQHIRRRVTLRLDSAIQTERRILERMDALPGRSGTDWLRALLTQGLLAEELGQSGGLSPGTQTPQSTAAILSDGTQSMPLVASQPDTPRTASTASTNGKPFARLQALVG